MIYTEQDPFTGETSTFGGIAEAAAEYHARGEMCPFDCARCEAAAHGGRPSPCLPATNLASEKQVNFLRQLATPPAPLPQVPAGRYAVAVPGDKNDVSFFKVDEGKGRWAGRVFVKQYASDTEYTLSQLRTRTVLALIAEDVEGAARRFGQLLEKCCRCGRSLTDQSSRAAGIGPECAGKAGW